MTSTASPWPCRHGDPAGRAHSPAAGPTRGAAGPRWPFPKGIGSWAGPVVAAGGRVALALDASVLVFGPQLTAPRTVTLASVHHLAATAAGELLAATSRGVVALDRDLRARSLSLLLAGKPPAGVVELRNGDLWAWRDTICARATPGGEVRWECDVAREAGGSGYHGWAIADDGSRAHAIASSWSSLDDPTEYYGTLLALSPEGLPLFRRDQELPTSTGLNLRLLALPEGVLLAENGAVLHGWDGHELWREQASSARVFAHFSPGVLAYVRDGFRLMRLRLPATVEPILELGRSDWIHDLVADGTGRLFLAERHTVIAVDERGRIRFRTIVPGVQSLLVGDGFLVGIQSPLALVWIE